MFPIVPPGLRVPSTLETSNQSFGISLDNFDFQDGEYWRHMVNMHSWVNDSMDELSNLACWVSSRVEFIHEEWMESF